MALLDDHQARHNKILALYASRDYSAAERILQEEVPLEIFRQNNYEYLLARIRQAQGKLKEAATNYQQIIASKGLLSEYAHFHLAELAAKQADYKTAINHLKELLLRYPDSRLRSAAQALLIESYLKTGLTKEAVPILQTQMNFHSQDGREAAGKLAAIYLQIGKTKEAFQIYRNLLRNSKDDQALIAAAAFDDFDERSARLPTEIELVNRARIYLFNRDSNRARRAYEKLIEKYPNSKYRPEALYSIGRAYYIADDFENAIVWYERVHKEYPNSDEGELGFYHVGHALQNLGRYRAAVARYKQMIDNYPNSQWLRGAHLNAIDSLRSLGEFDEALAWCDLTINRYGSDVTASTAIFNKVKIFLYRSEYQKALEQLQKLSERNLTQRAPGSTNRQEVEFLKGYCLEQLGRYSEAIEVYLSLPDTRNSFYGHRASMRLQSLAKAGRAEITTRFERFYATAKQNFSTKKYAAAKVAIDQALRLTTDRSINSELLKMLKECYEQLPSYSHYVNYKLVPLGRTQVVDSRKPLPHTSVSRAEELLFLGLYDEAALELIFRTFGSGWMNTVLLARNDDERYTQYSVAVYLNRGGLAHEAMLYAERNLDIPEDMKIELIPRDIAELLYPAPYKDDIRSEANLRGLDARYLLAIARQESRFYTHAKSPAAARGMFQFIASTAERIGSSLGEKNFDQSKLYNPTVSIRFAAAYLGELFAEFSDNPYAVAASYNAGEAATRRWLGRAKSSEPERFLPEVAYVESKDYVYKVMCNYWNYRKLYREDLQPKVRPGIE